MHVSQKHVEEIRASGLFDGDWYRRTYPDVARLRMDPAEHYLKYGTLMLRDPGPDFSVPFYMDVYPQVRASGDNALIHWLRTRRSGQALKGEVGTVLRAAYEVAQRRGYMRAIDLAEQHLPPELAYSAEILRANAAALAGEWKGWLRHVNTYLAHTGTAPLTLKGTGSLLHRLSTAALPAVEGPLVSVIMPAWNAEATIEMAVNSILKQTWRNIELIVVDDASTDDSWAILQRLAARDPRLVILRNTANVGPYVSKNIAVMGARGYFVTGHDADDWAHPERVARQAQYLMESGDVACMAGMLRVEPNGLFNRFNARNKHTDDGACRTAFISLMLDRRFFRQCLGAWDEVRFAGDSELLARLERVTRKETHWVRTVSMFCLDNPEGLTNHPLFGHNEANGISRTRGLYKRSFKNWHEGLKPRGARIPFPHRPRLFKVPPEAINKRTLVEGVIAGHAAAGWDIEGRAIVADIAIITDLRFPGGNASSTLDEVALFRESGKTVSLIHCPVDRDIGRPLSPRFDPHLDIVTDFADLKSLDCKVLIARNPSVICQRTFAKITPKITAEHAFFVKNNSSLRVNGQPVYEAKTFSKAVRAVKAGKRTVCPISPVMRNELVGFGFDKAKSFTLSANDWTPSFDLALYHQPPKAKFTAPYRIGRHGRDGREKWLEAPGKLKKVFPESAEFRIRILGGAEKAEEILGRIPPNWEVHEFGTVEPYDYLARLDAFVYFPNTHLAEGFGRTIVEAMIAGVPCILPPRFAEIFGDLALYCAPGEVQEVVRRLAERDAERIAFLTAVQAIAVDRYSSRVVKQRFKETAIAFKGRAEKPAPDLTKKALAYRKWLISGKP